MEVVYMDDLKIKWVDIEGKEIKPKYCKVCNKDISTITNFKGEFCINCAIDKGLIKV